MFQQMPSKDIHDVSSSDNRNLRTYVNLQILWNFPSVCKTGIQLFDEFVIITPENFPEMSYLNIEPSWYLYDVQPIRFGPHLWEVKERIIRKHMNRVFLQRTFQIFEKEMFAKMKEEGQVSLYMRKYLKSCRITKCCFNEVDAQRIYLHLSRLLIELNCKDSLLIADFFKTIFVTQNIQNFFLFESMIHNKYMYNLIDLSRKCKLDAFENTEGDQKFPVCPVLGCFLTGRFKRMRFLLTFGFQKTPFASVINYYRSGMLNPIYRKYYVTGVLLRSGIDVTLPQPSLDVNTLHRMFLAIEVMYVLCNISSDKRFSCKLIQSFQYLWRSIPDPYFSDAELNEIFQSLSTRPSRDNINSICSSYRNIFPEECLSVATPRSLKHLCRCGIRKCLRQNYILPEGVGRLPLPSILKTFLMLKS